MRRAVVDRVRRLLDGPRVQRALADLAFAVVLVALVWSAYGPSQKHAPRADHWAYLVDTMAHHHTVKDAVEASYSYNRTRTIGPGDTDLFRPVLFALLAAEQTLFAGDLWVYQTIGMILHCAVCLLMLTLMRQLAAIAPTVPGEGGGTSGWPRSAADFLPYALTGFFALNPAVQELVIWTHLHGYLLFLALTLASITLLLRHAAGESAGRLRSASLWGAWLLALVGAFTYEMGQFYAVLAGAFLVGTSAARVGVVRAGSLGLLFASILPVYQAVNAHDLEVHRGRYVPDNAPAAIREMMFEPVTVRNSVRFALFSTVQPFCPSLLQVSYTGGRIHVAETLWEGQFRPLLGPAAFLSVAALAVVAGLGAAGVRGLLRDGTRSQVLAVLLLAALYGLYSAMAVLGRLNLRPIATILTSNSYYAYTATALFLPLAYGLWQGAARGGRVVGAARGVLVAALAVLTFFGAERVRQTNLALAIEMREFTRPIRTINLFVKAHRNEPDFTFSIDYSQSDIIPPMHGVPVTQIFFGRWMTQDPKYRLVIRGGKALVLSGDVATAWPVSVSNPEPSRQQPSPGVRVGGLASRPRTGGGDGGLE